jgi:hypothetical protein
MKRLLAFLVLFAALSLASRATAEENAVDTRVPTLTVRVLATAPGMFVRLDGTALTADKVGVALPVTPGRHVVVVEAIERRPRTFVATLAEGESKTLDVTPGAGAYRANGAGPNSGVHDVEDSEHVLDYTQRTVGTSLAGAGVAGLGFGAIFGIVALSSNADDGRDEADNAGRISTGFLLGGAVAVIAGAIILFTAPSSSH